MSPTAQIINGQPARLRAGDGINLARPGKRKLAFYAEKPLAKALGDAVVPPLTADATLAGELAPVVSPLTPATETAEEEPEVVIGLSDLGPIDPNRPIMLRSPALDGGTELLGANPATRHEARTAGEKLAIVGIAPIAMAGRADDFSWSDEGATAFAAAIRPPEATIGKAIVPPVLMALGRSRRRRHRPQCWRRRISRARRRSRRRRR